jgi:hypothetical protein
MKIDGTFKDRYEKWVRKRIYNYETMKENLEAWFVQYKYTHTPGKEPGRGKKDPKNGKLLFTPDTKTAVDEALKKCKYIGDVLSTERMYTTLPATPHSSHGLNAYLCHRVESRLEGFHGPLSNFANSNTSASLADILTLIGTTQHNCNVRQKYLLIEMSDIEKKETPAHLLEVPKHYNHGELLIVNNNAKLLGLNPPFQNVFELRPDNGERFLSQYLVEQKKRNRTLTSHISNDRCQCLSCANNPVPLKHEVIYPTICCDIDVSTNEEAKLPPQKKKKAKKEEAVRYDVEMMCSSMVPVPTTSVPYPAFAMAHQANMYRMMQQQNTYRYQPPYGGYRNPFVFCGQTQQYPQSSLPVVAPAATAPKQKPPRKQTEICCLPFALWLNKPVRYGRPPHDMTSCNKNKK